jgi:ketosteroid isomerase-like protein
LPHDEEEILMSHPEDNGPVAVTERFLQALSALDAPAMFGELSEDATCEFPACPPGAPRQFVGRAACEGFFSTMIRPMWSVFALTDVTVTALAGDPERAVAEYTSDGLLLDGSPYHNTYLSMFTVRDGKIQMWREYFDPDPLVRGIGVLQQYAATAAAAGGSGGPA